MIRREMFVLFPVTLSICLTVGCRDQSASTRPARSQLGSNQPASSLTNISVLDTVKSTAREGELAFAEPKPSARHARDATAQRRLARQYCSACHLFPEPQLLTKREWAHHVLPQMASWLGVEPVNYESEKDGRMLEEAGVFPSSPILAEEDWFAIWDYYVSNAPSHALAPLPNPNAAVGLKNFRARKVNFHTGAPMTSLVKIDAAQKRIFVGDAFAGTLAAVDSAGRTLGDAQLGTAPVSLTEQTNGRFVTLIGRMFPSEALEGSVIFVPRDATGSVQTLLEKLRRPTHTAVGDLNQDGRADLVVCQFGNRLGRFSWFEAKAGGQFEEHVLLNQPGAIRSELRDLNRDGKLDIVVLMAQAREGIHIFYNQGPGLRRAVAGERAVPQGGPPDGRGGGSGAGELRPREGGQFRMETVIEQPPTFGYAGFEMVDFNRDGFLDILTVNGDNGDNPTPHKPYHGLRLYLNDAKNHFKEVWFYPMEGAYDARAADFDGDGDLDIAAIAFFPDFQKQPVEGFVYLENRGDWQFEPHTLREADAGRWMTMDAGDLDGDGDVDITLGSFTAGPTTIPIPTAVRDNWRTNGAAVLVLENLMR